MLKYTLIAIGLVAISAALDWLFFGDGFGLWAYTLGAFVGMVLALMGLITTFSTLALRRGERLPRLRIGGGIILTGTLTFVLSWLLWLILNSPT